MDKILDKQVYHLLADIDVSQGYIFFCQLGVFLLLTFGFPSLINIFNVYNKLYKYLSHLFITRMEYLSIIHKEYLTTYCFTIE